jgi:hypothetical protein
MRKPILNNFLHLFFIFKNLKINKLINLFLFIYLNHYSHYINQIIKLDNFTNHK